MDFQPEAFGTLAEGDDLRLWELSQGWVAIGCRTGGWRNVVLWLCRNIIGKRFPSPQERALFHGGGGYDLGDLLQSRIFPGV